MKTAKYFRPYIDACKLEYTGGMAKPSKQKRKVLQLKIQNKRALSILIRSILVIFGLVAVMVIVSQVYYFVRSEFDTGVSAKPEANRLLNGIKESGGTIVHTYNRTAFGVFNDVTTPSFEYYVEYDSTDTKSHIDALSKDLRRLGYTVMTSRYTATNKEQCSYYSYYPDSDGGNLKRCQDLTGATDPELFGETDNDGHLYYTLYAANADYTVHAESSDKTMQVTSNDFWYEEYAEQNHLEPERIPIGKSMLTIELSSKHRVR